MVISSVCIGSSWVKNISEWALKIEQLRAKEDFSVLLLLFVIDNQTQQRRLKFDTEIHT